jgi:hypothetical protein
MKKERCPWCMGSNLLTGSVLLKGDIGFNVWVQGNELVAIYHDRFTRQQVDRKIINFCPICGRKLEDV